MDASVPAAKPIPRREAGGWIAARARRVAREPVVGVVALAVVALHVVDDNFLQPQPGTSAGDHLASGLVPLAILAVVAATYPRLRAGVRASAAMTAGAIGSRSGFQRRTTCWTAAPRVTTTRGCCRSSPASCCS